jgi:hypothetical protein
MNDIPATDQPKDDIERTGLPWPPTWKGVYLFVIGSFVLWLLLLVALTESFA